MESHLSKSAQCLNCGYEFQNADSFCPICGQKNHQINTSFGHLLHEAVEGLLHFDSKTIRTIMALIFKPGFLTAEYNLGRRVVHIPPVRLYIFISFIFFLLINLTSKPGHQIQTDRKSGLTIQMSGINSGELRGLSDDQVDSLMTVRNIEKTAFKKYILRQLTRMANEGSEVFFHTLLKNISYMMFFLMPFFAVILMFFFRSPKRFYIEHLIYSIHLHSFLFFIGIFVLILAGFINSTFLFFGSLFVFFAYLYLSLMRVHVQKRFIVFIKTVLISACYLISLLGFIILTVMVSVIVF